MTAPHIIVTPWPSLCQKLSKLAEIWQNSGKKLLGFFGGTRYIMLNRDNNMRQRARSRGCGSNWNTTTRYHHGNRQWFLTESL